MQTIEDILEDFSFLEEWDDRYRYLIELGRQLPPYPDELRDEMHKVRGCVSQVWLHPSFDPSDDPIVTFVGDSDAHIVKGLVAIALAIFSGQRASDIGGIDETGVFSQIGLKDHLTPQRSNGLRSMVKRIKQIASDAASG